MKKFLSMHLVVMTTTILINSCGPLKSGAQNDGAQAGSPPIITEVLKEDLSRKVPYFSYVNLDRSPDRNAKMILQLDAAKVDYERWVAIEGKAQDRNDLIKRGLLDEESNRTNPLPAGVIGVYLSNLNYLEKRSQNDDGKMHFLLEDDVMVPIDVKEELATALKTVPKDWDLLYLGCNLNVTYDPSRGDLVRGAYERGAQLSPTCSLEKQSLIEGSPWIKMTSSCTAGAYAYTVRPSTLTKVINYLKPIKVHAIDIMYSTAYGNGMLNAYCLNPNLIRSTYGSPSTIR